MGTRNLTVVSYKNQIKIAQYGQYSGVPNGIGVDVLEFLKEVELDNFKNQLDKVVMIPLENMHELCDAKGNPFPQLDRGMEANVLDYIMFLEKEDRIPLVNQYDFGRDSLMCEFIALIDLDNMTYKCYRGFNKDKEKQAKEFYVEYPDIMGYYGVELVKTFDIKELPTEQEFLDSFKGIMDIDY